MTDWRSGNDIASGAGGLRFDSRAGQIRRSVANGSPSLQYFFGVRNCCRPGAKLRRWAPAIRYMRRRNTASIMQ